MQRLGECTSPVVDRTFSKRQSILTSKSARLWALINFVFALIMFYELSFGPISSYFGLQHILVWYLVGVLAAVFTINTIIDFCKFVAPSFSSAAVELTPNQKRLLGVRDSDLGFKLATPRVLSTSTSPTSTIISPSSFSSHSISGQSTPYSPTQGIVTLGSSPILTSRFSPNQRTPSPISGTPSPHHHYDSSGSYIANSSHISPSGSFLQGQGSSNTLNQSSLGASFNRSAVSPLSNTATLSPLFRENLDSSLRLRPGRTSMKNSPGECITDLNTLNSFLKEEQEKEMRSYLGSPENNPGNTSSFWNFGRTITDYTPVLKKYQYQIACRSPQSTKSPSTDPDDPSTFRAEQVWAKVNVHVREVDIWIENLRKWLGQTIMARLVIEIKNINRQLARTGSEDMQIGEVSISTLKSLAVTKSQLLPSLNTVIPFLEIGSNQEYLVQRIFQLGTGGCMHEFRWNGGGEYKGKPWADHLPTDAAIVMHCFCTYMDSRLPPHPKYPDGKTFTSQYYLKTPDKPDFKKKDNLLIYHFKINPPHYKVIFEDDTWDLPKGRNNMFQAILLFLHHVIVKHHGMLGRVNLGLSGINILWVLESNKMDDSDGSQRVKY